MVVTVDSVEWDSLLDPGVLLVLSIGLVETEEVVLVANDPVEEISQLVQLTELAEPDSLIVEMLLEIVDDPGAEE